MGFGNFIDAAYTDHRSGTLTELRGSRASQKDSANTARSGGGCVRCLRDLRRGVSHVRGARQPGRVVPGRGGQLPRRPRVLPGHEHMRVGAPAHALSLSRRAERRPRLAGNRAASPGRRRGYLNAPSGLNDMPRIAA